MGNITSDTLPKTIDIPVEVEGLAVLDETLYVLRKSANKQIWPYAFDTSTGKFDEVSGAYIEIPGLGGGSKKDMAECKAEKCLFVSDGDNKCIHRVEPKSKEVTSKWAKLPLKPEGLSMTPEGNLLVACEPNKLIELNVKTGEQVREIQLPSDIQNPKHAVKRKDKAGDTMVDRYVVCHWVKDGLHRVCLVNEDGTYRHCYGGLSGSGDLQLKGPAFLALCENNHVLVADSGNNRLVLLDPMLEFKENLVQDFNAPHRIYVDTEAKRGFVGEGTGGGKIKFYDIPKLQHVEIKPPEPKARTLEPETKGSVDGLAVVDGKLYVLRYHKEAQLCIYDADDNNNFKHPKERITIPDLTEKSRKDMTKCAQENCVFISNADGKCILKFDPTAKVLNKFASLSVNPKRLSMTPSGTLLATCEPDTLIELDVKTGEQVGEFKLPIDLRHPKHALKRRDGQFVLCHADAGKGGYHRISVLHSDGQVRHRYGDKEGSGHLELNLPCYLALMENDQVVVADNDNNRLVLLGYSLQFVKYLVENICEPHRFYVDNKAKLLYVGDSTDTGNIRVYDIATPE